MIIYRNGFVTSQAAAGQPLSYPRIGYQNLLSTRKRQHITASSEISNSAPKDALLRPDTGEYWQPTALPATWLCDLGASYQIDYAGLAAHTLGSLNASIKIQVDSDPNVPDPHLFCPGAAGNYALAGSVSAGLQAITGDLDIRARVQATDWTPAAIATIACRDASAATRVWRFRLKTGGQLELQWTADGATVQTATSTVATGLADGSTKWVKATLDADNGAGGNDVKFWMSDDNVTWTQLGATVTQAFIASIYNTSSSPINIGRLQEGDLNYWFGKIHYLEVRNGIGGSIQALFDASVYADGSTSLAAATGETYTVTSSGGTPERLNNNLLGTALAGYFPADDRPLMFIDDTRTGRYVKLSILSGDNEPQIAVLYVGAVLAMERMVSGPYVPISMARETQLYRTLSRGGNLLGQSFRRNNVRGTAGFKFLTADWVRDSFDDFSKSARSLPYFFAWNPETYPEEVGYVWSEKDIVPSYSGINDYMDVNWEMFGLG